MPPGGFSVKKMTQISARLIGPHSRMTRTNFESARGTARVI